MALLAADPEERFGSQSPHSSPPSSASSEATVVAYGPRPEPVSWDIVRKRHEDWMASIGTMMGSMDHLKPIVALLKKRREQEDQEFKKRMGFTLVRRPPILVSYDVNHLFEKAARSPPKQTPANVDTTLAKPRLPLRRSARIAQIQREENFVIPQKASQPSRKGPGPRMPLARRPALGKKISQREIAKKRGRPLTKRSQQVESSPGGSLKRSGRPQKILHTVEEAAVKNTRRSRRIASHPLKKIDQPDKS